MKPILHVWPQEHQIVEAQLTVSAVVELGEQRRTLWYRLPVVHQDCLSPNQDPFAIATVLMAMKRASQLVIHGTVSPSLLKHLEEFQAIWASWLSAKLSPVRMQADTEQEPDVPPDLRRPAIATFSGGVDSCYTAFIHGRGLVGRRQEALQAGLIVHGLDIPLKQTAAFGQAVSRGQHILASLDIPLIPLVTNFRQALDIDWQMGYATALASALILLQGRFRVGLIPSSYSYGTQRFVAGSNPLSDRWLGSDHFEMVHDGAAHNRFQKISAIADWPDAMAHLRVCWEGPQQDYNCGRCEKCIRTMLSFRLMQRPLPSCFAEDVSLRQIRRLRVRGGQLGELQDLLALAHAQNVQAPWVNTLASTIRRNAFQNGLEERLAPLKAQLRSLKHGRLPC
jgi:hypothetical protein